MSRDCNSYTWQSTCDAGDEDAFTLSPHRHFGIALTATLRLSSLSSHTPLDCRGSVQSPAVIARAVINHSPQLQVRVDATVIVSDPDGSALSRRSIN